MARRYDPNPVYPATGAVTTGFGSLAADLGGGVLAVDGPAAAPWEQFRDGLAAALATRGMPVRFHDMRRYFASWDEVRRRTAASDLAGDTEFARLSECDLGDLLGELPRLSTDGSLHVVYGPGAALLDHDRLWYAYLPRRLQLARFRSGKAANLGQDPVGPGEVRRLLFVDWPILERHRSALLGRLDRLVDLTHPTNPTSLDGASLRTTLGALVTGPFRTRPHALPGAWGGQWLRRVLGLATDSPNLAWSYELIAPEAGVVLGDRESAVEVPLDMVMAEHAAAVLGERVTARFGSSFPIRFDYLDTMDGGNLSLHCHPLPAYMTEVFGWDYTQHESYYVMATQPGSAIFLGLADGADLEDFRRGAETALATGGPLEVSRFVATIPAEPHRLYLIPAGTPHGSGAGNVVLEISATPYLYSLRFYDWQRPDLDGTLRPVHLERAFASAASSRRGRALEDLVRAPTALRSGPGFAEWLLGSLPEMFFEVRRLDFAEVIDDDSSDGVHVLALVDGAEVVIQCASGARHSLAYGETIVVPAAVGRHRLRRDDGPPCKVVKAVVR